VLAKVIRYETQFEPGEGRNRCSLPLARPTLARFSIGYSRGIATQMLSEKLAQHYVMDLLYESPASPYFVAPHYASRYVRAALERNPRIAVYTGMEPRAPSPASTIEAASTTSACRISPG
jgi:hypothetical protein